MDRAIHEKIEALTNRIQALARQQTTISNQLLQLINELDALKRSINTSTTGSEPIVEQPVVTTIEVHEVIEAPSHLPPPPPLPRKTTVRTTAPRSTSSFEEFIGKNVASKVGILVTIIGIFIGAKYAIEHEMVSPLVRVIAGYLSGAALIAVAAWLKKKYEAYSSVLMGGGLAVLYFITYIAYSFYVLMPQLAAFGLMLVFTAGTVYAALLYNRVIIAHLAQIGAYAIPFLLSDNSGRYAVFFAYMAIINTGILVVSLYKYWKSLFYAAFVLTWLIYGSWYFLSFRNGLHNTIAWTYLSIFFLIFYTTFLAYKIIKKERYELHDVFVLLSNAFIFYGIGYSLMQYQSAANNYAGVFTLVNAAIHLVVSQVIRRLQLADRSLYYLVLGLVIVFCTIAVPVQLDGNWVTLLWTAEAVLVFLIGRMRKAPAYEKLGAGLAVLSFLSLAQDGINHSYSFASFNSTTDPFINIVFATGLLVAAAQGAIILYNRNKKYQSELPAGSIYRSFYNYALPALLLVTGYFVFFIEINGYFTLLRRSTNGHENFFEIYTPGIGEFAIIVLLLYSLVYNIVCMAINQRLVRNSLLAACTLVGTALQMFMLLTQGLPMMNKRTINYFQSVSYFGAIEFYIRYIVFAVTAIMLYIGQKAMDEFIPAPLAKKAWSLMVHAVILSFLSAEYLSWTTANDSDNQYKLGLSILWGIYALALVVLGIRKKQKHLRLAGIVLFSVTLLKLFLYDLAGASTITKTVSFISLGVLLLVVSFLYNKYKEVLFGDPNRSGE